MNAKDDCPFCGNDDQMKINIYKSGDKIHPYKVRCDVCGNGTAHHGDWSAAWKAWSRRAPTCNATLQVAQPPEVRERVARTLYDCERLRSEHAASVLSAATGLRFAVPTPEMVAAGVEAGWPGECVYADEFDGPEAQVTAIYRAMAALIATSAVDGREIVERCASILDAVIAEGYRTPVNKVDTCEHGKYGWEDCIACYDEALTDAAARMRALSSGGT